MANLKFDGNVQLLSWSSRLTLCKINVKGKLIKLLNYKINVLR